MAGLSGGGYTGGFVEGFCKDFFEQAISDRLRGFGGYDGDADVDI
jgi:hypothetical protein